MECMTQTAGEMTIAEVSFSGISVVESLGECRCSRDRYDSVVELEWVDSSSAEVFD